MRLNLFRENHLKTEEVAARRWSVTVSASTFRKYCILFSYNLLNIVLFELFSLHISETLKTWLQSW